MSIPQDPDRWIVLSVANPARAAGLAAVAAGLASSRRLGVLVVTVVPPSMVSLPHHGNVNPDAWPAVAVALEGVRQRGVPAGWLVCASADVGRTVRQSVSRQLYRQTNLRRQRLYRDETSDRHMTRLGGVKIFASTRTTARIAH